MQYTVMPFGMCNAPATFQRLVNIVFADVPNCTAYLDDIVIHSLTWSDHISTLTTVFQRLKEASLILNLAKCEFGKAVVTYLGKQVGRGEVRPIAGKVEDIASFPTPKTRCQLRSFLGMVGYHRTFCKNFSTVVAPLTSLSALRYPSNGLRNVTPRLGQLKRCSAVPLSLLRLTSRNHLSWRSTPVWLGWVLFFFRKMTREWIDRLATFQESLILVRQGTLP